jgi:hypothetical protein
VVWLLFTIYFAPGQPGAIGNTPKDWEPRKKKIPAMGKARWPGLEE